MSQIKIHFVCLGNAYRSRLAEAYAKSLGLNQFEFSSSGVGAHLFHQRVPRFTDEAARAHNISQFLSPGQLQTTTEMLKDKDLVIFMDPDVHKQAKMSYEFDDRKSLQWKIDDMWRALAKAHVKPENTKKASRVADKNYLKLKTHVDNLVAEITRHNWIDIYDAEEKPLGFRHPISLANKKGLWHLVMHGLVVTADGRYLVEKRSKRLMMARGLLDISLGGYVDAGEQPHATILRETEEEIGVKVGPAQVHLLQRTKNSTYHPHYKKHTRGFTYSYLVVLLPAQINFTAQKSEVDAIYLLNARQMKRLIRRHYLKRFGRLNYPYKMYKTNLDLAERFIKFS